MKIVLVLVPNPDCWRERPLGSSTKTGFKGLRGPKISNQGTVGQQTYVALMISQKHLIIRWLKRGENRGEFMVSYNTGLSTICDAEKWKDQLQSLRVSSQGVKDRFK